MNNERKDTRVKRIPLHEQTLLRGETRDGFKRAWVFEKDVAAYKKAGWSIVGDPSIKTHDGQIQMTESFGSAITRQLNRGIDAKDRLALLMELPIELYNEDYEHEQRDISLRESLLDRTGELSHPNMYGTTEISRD